jgi:hypothetical protein
MSCEFDPGKYYNLRLYIICDIIIVVVYYCRTHYKAVRREEKGEDGGQVPTTKRGGRPPPVSAYPTGPCTPAGALASHYHIVVVDQRKTACNCQITVDHVVEMKMGHSVGHVQA